MQTNHFLIFCWEYLIIWNQSNIRRNLTWNVCDSNYNLYTRTTFEVTLTFFDSFVMCLFSNYLGRFLYNNWLLIICFELRFDNFGFSSQIFFTILKLAIERTKERTNECEPVIELNSFLAWLKRSTPKTKEETKVKKIKFNFSLTANKYQQLVFTHKKFSLVSW